MSTFQQSLMEKKEQTAISLYRGTLSNALPSLCIKAKHLHDSSPLYLKRLFLPTIPCRVTRGLAAMFLSDKTQGPEVEWQLGFLSITSHLIPQEDIDFCLFWLLRSFRWHQALFIWQRLIETPVCPLAPARRASAAWGKISLMQIGH